MSFAEERPPYGAMLGGALVFSAIRFGAQLLPAGIAGPVLVSLGAVAVAYALLALLRRRVAVAPRVLAALMLGQVLWTLVSVRLAGEPVPVNLPCVVAGLGLAPVLLWRQAFGALGIVMANAVLGLALVAWGLLSIDAWIEASMMLVMHGLLHATALGVAFRCRARIREERAIAAFDDEAFS